jgi:hypothetical protein
MISKAISKRIALFSGHARDATQPDDGGDANAKEEGAKHRLHLVASERPAAAVVPVRACWLQVESSACSSNE